jgi:ribosomal protein S27E
MNDDVLDYPLDEIVEKANTALKTGALVFFKWTCKGCGVRQTFERANTLYTEGQCEECGTITSLKERGCNFMLAWSRDNELAKVLPPEQTPFG